MPFLTDIIKQLLTQYDKSRGFFRFLLRDPPAIRALRKLKTADKNNILKVYQCFVKNLPKEGEAAYQVYKGIMGHVYKGITDHVSKKQPLDYTINLLDFLIKENFTTQTISDFLPVFHEYDLWLPCLNYLKNSQILTQENLDDIIKSQNFFLMLVVLNELIKTPNFGPLSQEMLDLLKLRPNTTLSILYTLVVLYRQADFINLQSLVRFLQLPEDNFLCSLGSHYVWGCIPPHLLTQAVFDQLIRLSQQQNPQQQIQQYVNQFIGVRENQIGLNREFVLNDQQSTHHASVHQSVSDSASKLFNLYSLMIEGDGLQDILQMIHDYIMQLPENSLKNTAAKKGIERIINLTFTDPGSGLTIPQLLALSFLAVHDSGKRIGDLSDAREQFVEGLYEIQRGYNLSENGHDRGGPDKPICIGGTFNKLIEKLEGIHPDVKVLHITPATASLKLPIVVREVALDYLASLAKSQTPEELGRFRQLIDQIRQEECVEIIWEHIKPKIVDRMFDEFGSLYTGKADPRFNDFIESGQYLKLENLSRFQEQIMASPDYQPSSLTFFSHLSASDSDLSCSPQSPDMSRRFGS